MASTSKSTEDLSRSLLILYATETGTAQDAADQIARQCRRILYGCRVMSMDTYALEELTNEELVIFVVSTTGSGTEPRSMTPLWNMLLNSSLPSDLFSEDPLLEFAVFALGDSSYEKFCWPGKLLSRRMEDLGARQICERGEGDEQHQLGIDGALQSWMEKLIATLLQLNPLPAGTSIIPNEKIPPPRISLQKTTPGEATTSDTRVDPLSQDDSYFLATLTKNERITAADWYQHVRHLEFDFDEDISYRPGDIAVIHPEASPADVETFLTRMGWGNFADDTFVIQHTLTDQSLPDHLPTISTLRTLFTRYLDLNAVPRRNFFQYLRYFNDDELEREKLDDFISLEGADELYEYCYRVRRTVLEVLEEFRNVHIPKEYVFDVFPFLRPRQFSISSSVQRHERQIHLCVAIVKYRTKLKIPRRGTCTSYLAVLQPGVQLRVGIRQGLLRLPEGQDRPLICVGPGTGIAPMRSLIEERISNKSSENTLYFGCRSSSKDQHYSTEWAQFVERDKLTYRTAFSRDGPEGTPRIYVQDLIREDSERIWDLLDSRDAWVYISGSSNKMPTAVKEALAYAVETNGNRSHAEAKEYVEEMIRSNRLFEECWS
ncbi:riboflavin synthase domain-like protein [Pluteus cervinus]|uniref:Riboflavin synthase domain-like protein n=1 Tax=Pluteus cervinus TaxID=181527 RepID=A0ACD3AUD3_9AGAR|nr:riboflavin synthase domain-like protein [Pluteus cervinus]